MKTFEIAVIYKIEDTITIEAENEDEAREAVYNETSSLATFYAVNDNNGAMYPWDDVEIIQIERVYL